MLSAKDVFWTVCLGAVMSDSKGYMWQIEPNKYNEETLLSASTENYYDIWMTYEHERINNNTWCPGRHCDMFP